MVRSKKIATELVRFPKTYSPLAAKARQSEKKPFLTSEALQSMLRLSAHDIRSGRYKILLYRFLTDNIPIVNACIWTWVRLAATDGEYKIEGKLDSATAEKVTERLEKLTRRLGTNEAGATGGLVTFLTALFTSLFRDGVFGGFVTVTPDASGVDRFIPVDATALSWEEEGDKRGVVLDTEHGKLRLERQDFYYIPLNTSLTEPLGRSILKAVPFVAYIEQQLVDDMRRASHNSGFHRLHVKITPPERHSGESDSAYIERINSYFDSTVAMIQSCDVDDNPVTWDNVTIEHIGPGATRSVTNSWFFNHRAMIEDICAGTNLSPFLLGYSYGATTTWSAFKFDIVMRQVKSIQAEVAHFLEWLARIDLALAGYDVPCRFVFDNTFAYQAADKAAIDSQSVENILKLFHAGLLDKETARRKAEELI